MRASATQRTRPVAPSGKRDIEAFAPDVRKTVRQARLFCVALLLIALTALIAEASVVLLTANHTMTVREALLRAIQFQGDFQFLAP